MNLNLDLSDGISRREILERHHFKIYQDITPEEIEKARYDLSQCVSDIPEEVIYKFRLAEADLLKYEFQKYIIHCAIEEVANIIALDGFDGARKTSISDSLTDTKTIYRDNIIQSASLGIPTKNERKMLITDLYRNLTPGFGKAMAFDRWAPNRVFIQKIMGYLDHPDQAEEFYDVLWEAIDQILNEDNVRLHMAFCWIDTQTQKEKIDARWEDPRKRFRVGDVDKAASDNHPRQLEELKRVRDTIENIDGLDFIIVDTTDKDKGLVNILKHFLRDKDYAKKSEIIDFNPDEPLNDKI